MVNQRVVGGTDSPGTGYPNLPWTDYTPMTTGWIDGLNRHRFANQPEILVNWESARNLVTVAPKANTTSVPPSGAGGDVRAAA